MSYRDKVKIAELEAIIRIYETALASAGMKPLERTHEPAVREEMGFVPKRRS